MVKEKAILRTPGPTPIPGRVQAAMNQPMIGHRGEEFVELFRGTAERLKPIFGTKQDILILSSSGTSALEAAVVNAVSPGEEVVVVVAGAFGDRFASICERYGVITHRLEIEYGEACSPEKLSGFLSQHPGTKAVIATYCETSTGVLNPVPELARVVREETEALFIVDGVSCIGGVQARMDDWGIDILVTGSQKAMMLPPGLAFAGVSERAWDVIGQNKAPSFYLSLPAHLDSHKKGMTPYTPAISLIYGLSEVCTMIEEEGFENVVRRHELMKKMTRAAIKALGLPLLAEDAYASPTVTSVVSSDDFDASRLQKLMKKEFHMAFAAGQKKLKGRLLRIGHMGWCFPSDVLTAVAYIELGLQKMSIKIEPGAGVKAAEEVYLRGI
ncbi:MAG TPA: alanine--glyoxylate aminotransferase family protein [Bacillales bacterium]|nr:alanine--glyoxylate aminotransferase family protein [Bacillales bacterium]